jgi:uncharacterized membrane protein YphA (DoxX/SURF4 family)
VRLLPNPRHRDLLGLVLRLVLGTVVLAAGLLKITQPETSARAVRAYQLLPYDVAGYVGYALPIVEVAIGLLLVVGLFTRVSAIVSGLLMVAFIIGISSAWAVDRLRLFRQWGNHCGLPDAVPVGDRP